MFCYSDPLVKRSSICCQIWLADMAGQELELETYVDIEPMKDFILHSNMFKLFSSQTLCKNSTIKEILLICGDSLLRVNNFQMVAILF